MIDIEKEVREALTEVGRTIIRKLKDQAPVDTGALKGSMAFKVAGSGNSIGLSFFYRRYGIYVDLGTYGNADRSSFGLSPFQMPAFNANPGRGGYGIRPRYWTSLSDPAFQDELLDSLIEKFETAVGNRVFDSLEVLRTSTKTKTS